MNIYSSLERMECLPFCAIVRFPLPSHTQTPGSDAGTRRDPLGGNSTNLGVMLQLLTK